MGNLEYCNFYAVCLEQVFIAQLHRRARLLNVEFQECTEAEDQKSMNIGGSAAYLILSLTL